MASRLNKDQTVQTEPNKSVINIYDALRRNHITTWVTVVSCSSITIIAIVVSFLIYKYQINHLLYIDSNGEVVPLQMMERRNALEIECKNHLNKWVSTYYTYDHNNVDAQRELGLWLIDSDDGILLEKFYQSKENNWFDKVRKFMITQKAILVKESIRIDVKREPYRFKADVLIFTKQNDVIEKYTMSIKGDIMNVSRNYPRNPHGLLIDHYDEGKKIKIDDEEVKENDIQEEQLNNN